MSSEEHATTVRLPADLLARIDAYAAATDRSRSAAIRVILTEHCPETAA